MVDAGAGRVAEQSGVGSAYGAAGSLVVFVVWVYYSGQVLFLGAEFTKAYAHRFGSRKSASVGVESPAGGRYN